MHEDNCFVTLTFSPENEPRDRSVDVRHMQLFLKKLRKRFGSGKRVFYCGEYGDRNHRPHYHALLFGVDFSDKKLWKINGNGDRVYISDTLAEIWGLGFCTLGDVTFESAAYCARYVVKKLHGAAAKAYYEWVDYDTGEVFVRRPEFAQMSRGSKKLGTGGIGSGWLSEFQSDVYPSDGVVVRGREMKPPKYYDRQFEANHPDEYARMRGARKCRARRHADNNTPARRKVREVVQEARLSMLPRPLDEE